MTPTANHGHDPAPKAQPIQYLVETSRLEHGDSTDGQQTREGDIAASYSADRIANGASIRQPFDWQGAQWICTGSHRDAAEAVRIVPSHAFTGHPTTYAEKTRYYQDDTGRETMPAREDPNGFYHGMTVKHAGKAFVLCGPKAVFVPGGQADQMSLFA